MNLTEKEKKVLKKVASYGKHGDTMLAHINPSEAALLKSRGGSGVINPNTGLQSFEPLTMIATGIAVASFANQLFSQFGAMGTRKDVATRQLEVLNDQMTSLSQQKAEIPGVYGQMEDLVFDEYETESGMLETATQESLVAGQETAQTVRSGQDFAFSGATESKIERDRKSTVSKWTLGTERLDQMLGNKVLSIEREMAQALANIDSQELSVQSQIAVAEGQRDAGFFG